MLGLADIDRLRDKRNYINDKARSPIALKKVCNEMCLSDFSDTYIKNKKELEENNMNSMDCTILLKKWKELNIQKIAKKHDDEKEELIKNDKVVNELNELIDNVKESFCDIKEQYNINNDKLKMELIFPNKEILILEETRKLIDTLEIETKEQLRNIERIEKEVIAATSICETEETLRKILKAYKIIDKDGKIIVK
jgi:hypothetical protein